MNEEREQTSGEHDLPVAYRQAGDHYILLEYGTNELDLRYRFRVYVLTEELRANPVPGVLELSPGVRSLQINYDSRVIRQRDLLNALLTAETRPPRIDPMRTATRVVHLPMTLPERLSPSIAGPGASLLPATSCS